MTTPHQIAVVDEFHLPAEGLGWLDYLILDPIDPDSSEFDQRWTILIVLFG